MGDKQYLLRLWGRDQEQVATLRTLDAVEDQHALCYWFDTPEARQVFAESLPRDWTLVGAQVDPSEDYPDTHKCTFARVTLELPNSGGTHTFEQSFGYGYPFDSVEWMYREGNYSCDCNRRLFLEWYCDVGLDGDDAHVCGERINLLKLEVFTR